MPAPHHSFFYRPDALSDTQPTASKYWRHFPLQNILTVYSNWCECYCSLLCRMVVGVHIFFFYDILMCNLFNIFREENIPRSTSEWSHGNIFCTCITVLYARRASFLWSHHPCDGAQCSWGGPTEDLEESLAMVPWTDVGLLRSYGGSQSWSVMYLASQLRIELSWLFTCSLAL